MLGTNKQNSELIYKSINNASVISFFFHEADFEPQQETGRCDPIG